MRIFALQIVCLFVFFLSQTSLVFASTYNHVYVFTGNGWYEDKGTDKNGRKVLGDKLPTPAERRENRIAKRHKMESAIENTYADALQYKPENEIYGFPKLIKTQDTNEHTRRLTIFRACLSEDWMRLTAELASEEFQFFTKEEWATPWHSPQHDYGYGGGYRFSFIKDIKRYTQHPEILSNIKVETIAGAIDIVKKKVEDARREYDNGSKQEMKQGKKQENKKGIITINSFDVVCKDTQEKTQLIHLEVLLLLEKVLGELKTAIEHQNQH